MPESSHPTLRRGLEFKSWQEGSWEKRQPDIIERMENYESEITRFYPSVVPAWLCDLGQNLMLELHFPLQ